MVLFLDLHQTSSFDEWVKNEDFRRLLQWDAKSGIKADSILGTCVMFTQLGTLWLDQSVHWKWLSFVNLNIMVSLPFHINLRLMHSSMCSGCWW